MANESMFDEAEFEAKMREKTSDELHDLVDTYWERHEAASKGRKAKGGVGTDTDDDDLMRESLAKIRIIETILRDRGDA